LNLVKSSFTLFETLLSITILTLVISGFINSTYDDKSSDENYMLLNSLENLFDSKKYDKFTSSNKTLQITINNEIKENISVKKYEFSNENIKVFKYEK
jgi:hypothetical protein